MVHQYQYFHRCFVPPTRYYYQARFDWLIHNIFHHHPSIITTHWTIKNPICLSIVSYHSLHLPPTPPPTAPVLLACLTNPQTSNSNHHRDIHHGTTVVPHPPTIMPATTITMQMINDAQLPWSRFVSFVWFCTLDSVPVITRRRRSIERVEAWVDGNSCVRIRCVRLSLDIYCFGSSESINDCCFARWFLTPSSFVAAFTTRPQSRPAIECNRREYRCHQTRTSRFHSHDQVQTAKVEYWAGIVHSFDCRQL